MGFTKWSSPNAVTLTLLQQPQTVFKVADIAMLTGLDDAVVISQRMAYAVKQGWLTSPRKGLYAKPGYNMVEAAGRLYSPSYLSLEYVLQKEGIIFQYDSKISMVSYLNREIDIGGQTIIYRKLKNNLLINPMGIKRGIVNEATKERAFLDLLYLNANCHIDNPAGLDKTEVKNLLALYQSPTLTKRALKIIEYA